jgi:hypothetical protein
VRSGLIDTWLEADREAPRKQRHTARRVWRRLVDEHGAQVSERQVRRCSRARPSRRSWRRTFRRSTGSAVSFRRSATTTWPRRSVKKVLKGRRRAETDRFVALCSHYLFESEFTALLGAEVAERAERREKRRLIDARFPLIKP